MIIPILFFTIFTLIVLPVVTASKPPTSYSSADSSTAPVKPGERRSSGSSSDVSGATFSAGSTGAAIITRPFSSSLSGIDDMSSSSIDDDIDLFFQEAKRALGIGKDYLKCL